MTKYQLNEIIKKELNKIYEESDTFEDLIFKLAGVYGVVLQRINNNK